MKTILFLAVLLFVAQSSPLHEIYRGFILNLPMKAEVQTQFLNSGYNCLNNFEGVAMNLIQSLQRDIPAKNYFDILRTLLVADDVLEHKIAPECLAVYQELVKFFVKNKVPLPGEAENDYFKLIMYIVSAQVKSYELIAHIVADVISHRAYYSAGEKFAYMGKLFAGMERFELQIIHDIKPVPFHPQRFVYEFFPSFLQEISADSYSNNQTALCLFDLFNTTLTALANPNLHRGDALTATHAFLEGAIQVTDSVQRCSEKVDLTPVMRLFRLFENDPVQFTSKFLANDLLNLSANVEAQANCRIHILNGNYSLAGRECGKSVRIHLKGLAF